MYQAITFEELKIKMLTGSCVVKEPTTVAYNHLLL